MPQLFSDAGDQLGFSPARNAALANQFRQRPVIADDVMRAAGEVGELRGGDIDAQTLIERGEDVAEMDRPGARLLAPARCRAEYLSAAHAAAGHERAANPRPMVAATI